MGNYFVYILTNSQRRVLYIGMTNDLEQRLVEHYLNRGNKSFTGRYYCYYLLYYERLATASQAITREKELKDWNRKRKEALIHTCNPEWNSIRGSF